MPFFSVIIPTYNRARLLGAALDSVFAQTFKDCELIVADDGSTDETSEVIQRFAPRILHVRQENAGPGAARNLGIRHATGQYIAFLDSDDLWFPWTLETYRRGIEQYKNPAFVAGKDIQFFDASTLPSRPPAEFACEHFADYFIAASPRPFWIGMCAAAIQTEHLRATGGFTPLRINSEDSDLWMKLGAAPGFVHILNPPVFGYRSHALSAISNHQRSYEGFRHLIQQENSGQYPGGPNRRLERRQILATHLRPASIGFLNAGFFCHSWSIYFRTLRWNLRQCRLKYLLAFPLIALRSLVAGRKRA